MQVLQSVQKNVGIEICTDTIDHISDDIDLSWSGIYQMCPILIIFFIKVSMPVLL